MYLLIDPFINTEYVRFALHDSGLIIVSAERYFTRAGMACIIATTMKLEFGIWRRAIQFYSKCRVPFCVVTRNFADCVAENVTSLAAAPGYLLARLWFMRCLHRRMFSAS